MEKWDWMREELERLNTERLFRQITVFDSPQAALVEVEGRQQHLFSSNSYLDLRPSGDQSIRRPCTGGVRRRFRRLPADHGNHQNPHGAGGDHRPV